MADRFPLILNTSANQIQEIASGDTLDLTGNNISNAGVITATSFSGPIVAGAGTSNITAGIITAVTFKGDGDFFDIDVDGHTNLDNVNISGVSTFAGAIDLNSDIDVDGHTNLDNVSIAGVTSVASLTSGRVVTVGTAGKLQDSNNLTFDSSELTLTSRHLLLDTDGYRIKLGTANDFQLWHTGSANKIQSFVGNIEYISPAGSGHSFQVNSQEKLSIASNGNVSISQDLDVDGHTNLDNVSVAGVTTFAGTVNTASIVSTGIDLNGDLDVDGHTNLDNLSVAGVSTFTGAVTTGDHVTLSGQNPHITFTDTNHNPNFEIYGSAGNFKIWDSTSNVGRLIVNSAGHVDIPGNLSVGGVLTYEDVTNVDSVGIVTARNGINCTTDGVGKGINIGAGSDLILQHNGTNSYIDNNTGDLYIQTTGSGDDILIESADDFTVKVAGSETAIQATGDGAVELFHDNAKKVETFANGIIVYGPEGGGGLINLYADEGDDNADKWRLHANPNGAFYLQNYTSGSWENSISAAGNSGTSLYFDNAVTLTTTVNALHLFGNASECNIDLKLSNGNRCGFLGFTNSGRVQINGAAGGNAYETYLEGNLNGSTKLFYDNSERFATTSTGVKVTGDLNQLINPIVASSNGTGAPASVGHTASNNEGIFWHTDNTEYGIWRGSGAWSGNYQQLNIHWQTGIVMNGGSVHGLSGVRFASHTMPHLNNSYDLGTTSLRWRNIYTNDLNLSNEGGKNEVDGTWGNYTIQEGESDLFLINKRSGKKYKFNLTEVL